MIRPILAILNQSMVNAVSSSSRAAIEGEGRADIILPLHDFVVNLHKPRL